MAQTKTVVTVNGEKVTINPNSIGSADNGLTAAGGNIQLGGPLTKASVLTTTSAFTLALKGLQPGANTDNIVVTDANGVLKLITPSSLSGTGPWYNVATNAQATANTQDIYQLGKIGIGTLTPHAQLQLANTVADRKIVLYEDANNDNQFYGFGVQSSLLKLQAPAFSFNSAVNATSSTELMRLNATGLGIGTITPTAKLDVAGKTVTQSAQIAKGTDDSLPAAGLVATAADDKGNIKWAAPAASNVMEIKVIHDNYPIAANDYTIIASKLNSDITLTLPAATTCKGRILIINQIGVATASGSPVAVKFNVPVVYSDTVRKNQIISDYYSTSTGGSMKVTLQSDGTDWYVISFM